MKQLLLLLQPLRQTALPGCSRIPEKSKEMKSTPPHLVFQGDLGPQGVVGVPLFREGESMLRPLVLGLQGSGHLTGLGVGRARAGELLRVRAAAQRRPTETTLRWERAAKAGVRPRAAADVLAGL